VGTDSVDQAAVRVPGQGLEQGEVWEVPLAVVVGSDLTRHQNLTTLVQLRSVRNSIT